MPGLMSSRRSRRARAWLADANEFQWHHLEWVGDEDHGIPPLARNNQITPPDWGWNVWLLLAGRGFGKTRTAAEDKAFS